MIVAVLILLMVFSVFLWKDTRKPKRFPPGPAWLPIIGCIPVVSQLLDVYNFHHLVWQHFLTRYGPIVGLRVGKNKLVLISGKAAVRDFYSREECEGRPDGFFFRIRYFDKRLGLVFNDGKEYEMQRRFSMKTLKQLGSGRNGMISHVEKEAAEMIEYFKAKAISGQPIDMHKAFDIPVLNVMWALMAGSRFHVEDERLLMLLDMIHKSFRVIDMSGGILNQFPFVRHFFPEWCGYSKLLDTLRPIWKFLIESINQVQDNCTENDSPESLIEAYLAQIKKANGANPVYTGEQLLSLCIDFFQAGSETTSNTLAFGMIYMLHNEKVWKKVQAELESVVGRSRLPCLADRPSLPYIEAVICEIQRFSNVAPLAIAHRITETIDFGEYSIPKNTIALISLYSLNMDVEYWKDPFIFRPERFLDSAGNLIQHDQFIPFGLGKRRCIGETIARTSLFLFFTSFAHMFDISVPEKGKLPDIEGLDGISLSPKPYKVNIAVRY